MSYKYIFFLVYFSCISFNDHVVDNGWELKKFDHGISVYTKTSTTSGLKELRAITQVKASLSSIITLLNDWESYPQWVYRCEVSKTLKKITDTEFVHYQTITTPWPVDYRDFVVYVKLSQDDKTKIVIQKSTSLPDYIVKVDNYVRITQFKASWTLTPVPNGYVNVEYQLLVDPGGNVPVWLVNMAVVEGPYETLLHLKQWVTKEKYQKSKLSFIQELE